MTTLQEVGGSQICMRRDVRPDVAAFGILRGRRGGAPPAPVPDPLGRRTKRAECSAK